MSGRLSVFNSVGDLDQLGQAVMYGFYQVDANMLPQGLQESLRVDADRLGEGMSEQFKRLCNSQDSPVTEAEKELFVDRCRMYGDKIPNWDDICVKWNINLDHDAFRDFA